MPFNVTSTLWEPTTVLDYCCPAGDGGNAKVAVRLKDCTGDPVAGVPAEEIVAVLRSDTAGSAVACTGTRFEAVYATGSQGESYIAVPKVGGCGDLIFDVYAQGILMGQVTLPVRSPDLNGDCTVDAKDDTLFTGYVVRQNPCADFDGNGIGQSDIDIFREHYFADGSEYHFSIHPGYSSAAVTASNPSCMVLCPGGDIESLSTLVIARNAHNSGFPYSSIPAEYIWSGIDWGQGFEFVCSEDCTRATADGPTWGPEKATITVSSGGGYHETPWTVTTFIGGDAVGEWTGHVKSPDMDASGVVGSSDMSLWSEDHWWCYWQGDCDHYRSDLNCDGTIDGADFDVIDYHYKHRCGASSQMAAEGQEGSASWTVEDATRIRSYLANVTLDNLLAKALHPELKALLTHVRSMAEPDSLTAPAGKVESAAASLLPNVTSMAQSFPNPSNGAAVIAYQVAPPGGHVSIVIFDAAGRRVRALVDGRMRGGYYAAPWNGENDGGRKVASGVYFYRMKAPGFTSNKRMMLVRR